MDIELFFLLVLVCTSLKKAYGQSMMSNPSFHRVSFTVEPSGHANMGDYGQELDQFFSNIEYNDTIPGITVAGKSRPVTKIHWQRPRGPAQRNQVAPSGRPEVVMNQQIFNSHRLTGRNSVGNSLWPSSELSAGTVPKTHGSSYYDLQQESLSNPRSTGGTTTPRRNVWTESFETPGGGSSGRWGTWFYSFGPVSLDGAPTHVLVEAPLLRNGGPADVASVGTPLRSKTRATESTPVVTPSEVGVRRGLAHDGITTTDQISEITANRANIGPSARIIRGMNTFGQPSGGGLARSSTLGRHGRVQHRLGGDITSDVHAFESNRLHEAPLTPHTNMSGSRSLPTSSFESFLSGLLPSLSDIIAPSRFVPQRSDLHALDSRQGSRRQSSVPGFQPFAEMFDTISRGIPGRFVQWETWSGTTGTSRPEASSGNQHPTVTANQRRPFSNSRSVRGHGVRPVGRLTRGRRLIRAHQT